MALSNLEFSRIASVQSASEKSQALKAPSWKLAPLICNFDKLQQPISIACSLLRFIYFKFYYLIDN